MADGEVVGGDGVIYDTAELRTFLGFDFEAGEVKVETEDFVEFDDVGGLDELVDGIDNATELRVFADGAGHEELGVLLGDEGAGEVEGDNFESVGVDDGSIDMGDGGCGLHTENWCAEES